MAKANGIVTFLTDFDTKDGFVGTMKGVILNIFPEVRFVDISNHITPQKIWEGAFVLRNSYHYFPDGTVHLAVVDPGVGSEREGIIVETKRYFFVAPDNGLVSLAYKKADVVRTIRIQNTKYFLQQVSSTFHGRDIFSAVAAHIARGVPVDEFGQEAPRGPMLNFPGVEMVDDRLYGKIIHVDTFGNIITNISLEILKEHGFDLTNLVVEIGSHRITDIKKTYFDVPAGEEVALVGSAGFIEIAINQGNAAKELRARTEDDVCVRRRD